MEVDIGKVALKLIHQKSNLLVDKALLEVKFLFHKGEWWTDSGQAQLEAIIVKLGFIDDAFEKLEELNESSRFDIKRV